MNVNTWAESGVNLRTNELKVDTGKELVDSRADYKIRYEFDVRIIAKI